MSGPPPVPPLSQGQYASKTVGTQQKDMKGKGSPENPGEQKYISEKKKILKFGSVLY